MEKLPADLAKVLKGHPQANALWTELTPIGRRDFISWIESAKQSKTRKRRIESVPSRLLSGKRRPCCYALVPMNLYKALATFPKAKTTWKDLTPDERRDFTDWIEKAKDTDARRDRVDTTCARLAAGKRRP
ncbi:YdeI/OmpD-associated family protein [Patescibacteria group bacterium]|nr:YdeI/OmpD-associated family protein [Patescibacteria group bacterium]